MGYRHKSYIIHERIIGLATVGKTLSDDAALAIANKSMDIFERLDDAGDAYFCNQMEDWRNNKPDVYEAFWWWRKTHEDAAKKQNEDEGEDHRIKGRAFSFAQYLAAPFSGDWEDDRQHLKPGVVPWITAEQIEAGLDHKAIKRWFWAWHGRDVYTAKDEVEDRNGNVKAGERKFLHVHVVLEVPNGQYVDVIARWFGIPEHMVKVLRGRGAFLDMVEYVPHESPRAVEDGKTHYDDDEMHASPGFDYRKELTDLQEHRAKYGKRAGEMTPADTMRMHVMNDGWTLRDCRRDDPLTYSKIRSTLPPLRLDYLMDSDPCPLRINIYVEGKSGVGKSSFCVALAEALFPAYEYSHFTIGADERVTFDGYDGEPVIIWEEQRAVDFIAQFRRDGTLRLLDSHPKVESQQAKHSRVVLTNAFNIINGIETYQEFLDGLAGRYVDKNGVAHEAEQDVQVYRRMPIIIRIRADDFDIMLNKGILNDDLESVKQFYLHKKVFGSMRHVMERLDGAARSAVIGQLMAPVVDAAEQVTNAHDTKVSEVEDLPSEFARYGELVDFPSGALDEPFPARYCRDYDIPAELTYYATPRDLPTYPSLLRDADIRIRSDARKSTGAAVEPTDEEKDALIARCLKLPQWFTGGQVEVLGSFINPLGYGSRSGRDLHPQLAELAERLGDSC